MRQNTCVRQYRRCRRAVANRFAFPSMAASRTIWAPKVSSEPFSCTTLAMSLRHRWAA
jgi:hypothetical protein